MHSCCGLGLECRVRDWPMDSTEKPGSMQTSERGLLANFLSVLMILVDSQIFVIFQGCSMDFLTPSVGAFPVPSCHQR